MKKSLKIILIVVVSLLIVYFVIKGILLITYNNSVIEDDAYLVSLKETLANNEQMNVTTTNLENDEYYTFDDINFINLNMEVETISDEVNLLENGETTISINMSESNLVDQVKGENHYFLNNLLEDENITTDYELLKFIVNNYNKDVNILSSIKTLREAIEINTETKIIMNSSTNIMDITGSLDGYVLVMNDGVIMASLTNNDKYYNITFYDYNLTEVNEFLNTIYFTN